jgi:hypothetical protein
MMVSTDSGHMCSRTIVKISATLPVATMLLPASRSIRQTDDDLAGTMKQNIAAATGPRSMRSQMVESEVWHISRYVLLACGTCGVRVTKNSPAVG